ncbi:MAG: winged helix-turn-helix transcriptional regulator [Spirochaetales bacterium]|nr:winged helix-turn-helix transcriptional regulator [Spirochaetales bacterium]
MDREKETIILEQLSQNKEPVKQRELAQIAGLSLGMTNGLLKRMADKGLLMMEKVNSRNIKYILTPEGRKELNRRTQKYMKRTIKNVVYYREAVEELVRKASEEGYEGISLMGKSDLDFILEWACQHYGMEFTRNEIKSSFFTVFSEKGLEYTEVEPDKAAYLGKLEIKGEVSL